MILSLPDLATAFMLTFARVGTLVMLFPAIGDRTLPGTVRLAFALLLALVLLPLARTVLPAGSAPPAAIATLVGEVAIGATLGLATRIVVAALQTAGAVVAQQLGLSFAMTVDPSYGGQDAAIGNFLTLLGVTLVFTTDLHHVLLLAIRDSYALLPPVGLPEAGDAVALALAAVGRSFSLAARISAPFIAFAILFNLGLGILSRLMPQIQVFFVGVPLSIVIGMLILLAALGLMMAAFLDELRAFVLGFGAR